jgi:hypothetical protein
MVSMHLIRIIHCSSNPIFPHRHIEEGLVGNCIQLRQFFHLLRNLGGKIPLSALNTDSCGDILDKERSITGEMLLSCCL